MTGSSFVQGTCPEALVYYRLFSMTTPIRASTAASRYKSLWSVSTGPNVLTRYPTKSNNGLKTTPTSTDIESIYILTSDRGWSINAVPWGRVHWTAYVCPIMMDWQGCIRIESALWPIILINHVPYLTTLQKNSKVKSCIAMNSYDLILKFKKMNH
jgi:hypothetical protein